MRPVRYRSCYLPVGKIVDHGKEICFPAGMKMGPVTQKLYETLTGIQMGQHQSSGGLDPRNQIRTVFFGLNGKYGMQKAGRGLFASFFFFLLFSLFTQFFEKILSTSSNILAQKSFFCLHLMIESFFHPEDSVPNRRNRLSGSWNRCKLLESAPARSPLRTSGMVPTSRTAHILPGASRPCACTLFDCRDLRMCQRAMIDHPAVVTLPMILSSYTITQPIGTSPSAQAFASRIAAFIYFSSRVNFAATVFPLHCFIPVHPTQKDRIFVKSPLSRKIG